MPISVKKTSGNNAYANPFLEYGGLIHGKLDVSVLTSREVDAKGYLKPGVPFKLVSNLLVLCDATSGEFVYAATVEAIKIADDNTTLSSNTSDPLIGVATRGALQRDIGEDNLGAVYSAAELAAFDKAGSHFRITTT